jgi:hypothetical protein
MPAPLFLNIWACNPWATKDDPSGAAAQQSAGSYFATVPVGTSPDIVDPGSASADPGAEDDPENYSDKDWYIGLTKDWGSHGPVIPPNLYVSHAQDDEVRRFMAEVRKVQKDKIECYDRADYQLYLAGFRTTPRPSKNPDNWQILIENLVDGKPVQSVQVNPTIEAVMYMHEALGQDIPVLVGVNILGYKPRPNDTKATPFIEPQNHYVVVVGYGENDEGVYFDYYDYLDGKPEHDDMKKFYLQDNMHLGWKYDGYIVAEVRRTLKR